MQFVNEALALFACVCTFCVIKISPGLVHDSQMNKELSMIVCYAVCVCFWFEKTEVSFFYVTVNV